MDPYYTPVQVDSYIQKCESTRSVFEYLTQHTSYQTNSRTTEFVEQPEDFPSMAIFTNYSHSYMLQLPPLKAHPNPPDALSSDYQPFATSTPTAHQAQQDPANYFNVQDDLNASYWQTRRHVACLNLLFDGKQHDDSKNNSSYSHSTSSDDTNATNKKDSEYDLDSVILEELQNSEADSSSDITQDDCIMLTFPPTEGHSCGDNVTTVESKAEETGDKEEVIENGTTMEEHLLESNLTINPHHFDPL